MKKIKLGKKDLFALVDDEDYELVNKRKWTFECNERKNGLTPVYYARRMQKGKKIRMHRFIMNAKPGEQIDHIDHNGLNNQKSNLRFCNNTENRRNVTPYGKSKYLGVNHLVVNIKRNGIKRTYSYITAQITINKKNTYLGIFQTEEDAAKAFDEMAKIYYGEFANLNFK